MRNFFQELDDIRTSAQAERNSIRINADAEIARIEEEKDAQLHALEVEHNITMSRLAEYDSMVNNASSTEDIMNIVTEMMEFMKSRPEYNHL